MDFLKISIWLLTAILSVSSQRSHTGCHSCPWSHSVHSKPKNDLRNCFCFNNHEHYKTVPEVINHHGGFSERLVYYVYRDLQSGNIKLYIPNREKQFLIPDLPLEEDDKIIDNPSDVLHSFNDLFILKDIIYNNDIITEPSVFDDTTTIVSTDQRAKDKVTVTDENATATTQEPTLSIEKQKTVTNELTTPTIAQPTGTTDGQTTITDEPFTTDELNATTLVSNIINEETIIKHTPEIDIITKKPTIEHIPETTDMTEEPTTAHTPDITFISEETTVEFPSTKEPSTIESSQPTVTTDVQFVTSEETTFTTRKPNKEKSPETNINPTEETTSEESSPVIISLLPDDDINSGKVLSIQDLYKIIQFVQKKKDAPTVDLWKLILMRLNRDKSQVNKFTEPDNNGQKIVFDLTDKSELKHNAYTFDRWFQQQLNGFSESDNFISLVEIKQYVRNILMRNGMIVTTQGLLTDLEGAVLDLRELKLRPILIGKPLNIGQILEHKSQKSDSLFSSDSPYMQAIVVTFSNPSMILGIIPLGKTILKKTVQKNGKFSPPGKVLIKEWMQNGNNYVKNSNKVLENLWFNIRGPKPGAQKDYSVPYQNKVNKHNFFTEPKYSKTVINFKPPQERYNVKSSKLLEILKENDLRKLYALQKKLLAEKDLYTTWQTDGIFQSRGPLNLNLNSNEVEAWKNLLKDNTRSQKDWLTAWQNDGIVHTGGGQTINWNVDSNEIEAWENLLKDKTRSKNDRLTAWQNGRIVQTGGGQPLNWNVDSNEIEAWQNLLKDNTRSGKKWLTPWKNKAATRTDSDVIPGLNVDDSSKFNILNNEFKMNSKSIPANRLISGWRHLGHLKAGNEKLDPIELNALKNKLIKKPTTSEVNQKLSDKLYALKSNFLQNPATLQGNANVKDTDGTNGHKVDLEKNYQLGIQLLKDPKIFSKMANKLLSALQRKGIVQGRKGEAIKLKLHNPREVEALRNQLLKDPKIFAMAAKEILTVMDHNGIAMSDIAPVINKTSPEDTVASAEKKIFPDLSPEKGPWSSEDAVGYYDEVEDDITGRIIGGSAATGSGAPLSIKGRMKDF